MLDGGGAEDLPPLTRDDLGQVWRSLRSAGGVFRVSVRQLGNLDRVQRRALKQIIRNDPQVQSSGLRNVFANTSDKGFSPSCCSTGERVNLVGRIIHDNNAGGQ